MIVNDFIALCKTTTTTTATTAIIIIIIKIIINHGFEKYTFQLHWMMIGISMMMMMIMMMMMMGINMGAPWE